MGTLKLIASLVVIVGAVLGVLLVLDVITLVSATDVTVKVVEAAVIVVLAGFVVSALARPKV